MAFRKQTKSISRRGSSIRKRIAKEVKRLRSHWNSKTPGEGRNYLNYHKNAHC